MIDAFLHGLMFGILVAAPVGPMSMLCMHRTILKGPRAGVLTGLGIACADGLYGVLAVSGWSIVPGILKYQTWFRVGGGIFLAYLGISILLKKQNSEARAITKHGGDWLSAFGLTLSNPPTILAFMALIASHKIGSGSLAGSGLTALGIGLGSFLWWNLVVFLVSRAHHALPDGAVLWVNRVSGLVFLVFAVACFIPSS
jgi:threonine/homoserine/homoserine lactone efflux protein